jgi:hypothetical protein
MHSYESEKEEESEREEAEGEDGAAPKSNRAALPELAVSAGARRAIVLRPREWLGVLLLLCG